MLQQDFFDASVHNRIVSKSENILHLLKSGGKRTSHVKLNLKTVLIMKNYCLFMTLNLFSSFFTLVFFSWPLLPDCFPANVVL